MLWPVPVFTIFMPAFATTPPLGSVTLPMMEPYRTCAVAVVGTVMEKIRIARAKQATQF
jgi:hypothetical protein